MEHDIKKSRRKVIEINEGAIRGELNELVRGAPWKRPSMDFWMPRLSNYAKRSDMSEAISARISARDTTNAV